MQIALRNRLPSMFSQREYTVAGGLMSYGENREIKKPLPGSGDLLARIKEALTPNRLPLLIAIDGASGCGKSSLASWLAWQLEMPAVQLDLYLMDIEPLQWETADLERVLARRLERDRPVILDGLLVLEALQQVGRKPDFLVFVVSDEGMRTFGHQVETYRLRHHPFETADFIIRGFSEDG